MNERYEKIIDIAKPESEKHSPMPCYDRAAQFAPFAALTGFDAEVKEEARLTESRIELDEYEIEILDRKLKLIAESGFEMLVAITYFLKDKKKTGGKYVTKSGRVLRIDEYEHKLIFDDGNLISIEDIADIKEIFYESQK